MAANIRFHLEKHPEPQGQIYYDTLFDQLQDTKGVSIDFGSAGPVSNQIEGKKISQPEPNEEMWQVYRLRQIPYQQLLV